MPTKVDVEFEVRVGEDDGIVQIRRWVWGTRGWSPDEWTIGTREQAFKLATDIMETLAFHSPISMPQRRGDDDSVGGRGRC